MCSQVEMEPLIRASVRPCQNAAVPESSGECIGMPKVEECNRLSTDYAKLPLLAGRRTMGCPTASRPMRVTAP